MITLYCRRGIYWYRNCEYGKQERHSLKTRDKQTARALLRQMELDVLSGGRLRRITWQEFEREFMQSVSTNVRPNTLRGYRITADRFGRFFEAKGSGLLQDVSPATIAAFIEDRKQDVHPWTKRTLSPGGMRFDLRVLHRVFSYAAECGYISANPVRVRNLNAEGGKTMPFEQKEIAAMLADPLLQRSAQLRAIVLTFLHTGLRISDVIHLPKKALAGGTLIRQTIKRRTVVSMAIHPEMLAAVNAHLEAQNAAQRESPTVFSTEQGRPIVSLDKILRRLWKRCGVAGGHAHRFRDTFSVRLLQKGASLYDVSRLLGISMQTAERHYAPYTKELRERGASLVAQLDFVG